MLCSFSSSVAHLYGAEFLWVKQYSSESVRCNCGLLQCQILKPGSSSSLSLCCSCSFMYLRYEIGDCRLLSLHVILQVFAVLLYSCLSTVYFWKEKLSAVLVNFQQGSIEQPTHSGQNYYISFHKFRRLQTLFFAMHSFIHSFTYYFC